MKNGNLRAQKITGSALLKKVSESKVRVLAILPLLAALACAGFSAASSASSPGSLPPGGTSQGAGPGRIATVSTDRNDYAPGETATIGGTGWTPGETVQLSLKQSKGRQVFKELKYVVFADAGGKILSADYVTAEEDRGTSYELTAAGETSGLSSLTTFSDALGLTSNLSASVSFPAGTTNPPCPGAPVTLTGNLTNVSAGNYTYQWWRGTQAAADPSAGWPNNGFTAMAGASGSFPVSGDGNTLSANPVAAASTTADSQFFYVLQVTDDSTPTPKVIYSQFGDSTLHVNTVSTVTAGAVTADPATILCDPTGTGIPLTLTVTAGGDGPFTYTWEACPNDHFNPVNTDLIRAGTSTSSTTDSLSFLAKAGDPDKFYRVTITGSCNTASSIIGPVKVTYPVKNIVSPQNASTVVGVAATFTSTAQGNPVPTVQWQKLVGLTWTDITDNPSATTTTFSVTPAAVSESGAQYRAAFTNNSRCGPVTGFSNPATLSVGKGTATVTLAGLSQTFDGTAKGATATTAPGGLATVVSYGQNGSPVAAPTNAGSYDVSATVNDINYQGSASGTLIIAKAAQAISFAALPDKTFGDHPLNVSATGGASGNPVTFTATGNCTAGGTNGSIITLTAAGSCTVNASQAGNGNYSDAASVARSFLIAPSNRQNQTVTFGALANRVFGDADFAVSATASSGLPVSFSGAGGCTVGGSTVHIVSAGSCIVTASQFGDSNFNAAADVDQSFQIAKATQTVTFGALPDKTFGDAPFSLSATGGASTSPVTFTATGNCTAGGTNGSTITLTGAGLCMVTASQAADQNFSAAADVQQSFQIAKASTALSVSSSANPSVSGQAATFTATVSSAAGVPTGSVQFQADGTNLGAAVPLDAGGVAALNTSGLTAGTHAINASYSGDANFTASSGALSAAQVVGGAFEFSQASYSVGERDGFVTIKVKRTGDTTSAMTVNYATDGNTPSAAVPCSAATGIALEHCDYNRAAGTLRFAVGDAEKSFDVLVNDDSYTEGPESFMVTLSNPTGGASLGAQSSATVQVTDDSPESSGNPVDDSQFFVRQHYHDFLSREPDSSGLQFWTNGIESCGADSQCRAVKKVDTSAAFYLSIEFKETGYLVYRLYKTAFGNLPGKPVPVVFRQFLRDTQEIGRGVVVGQQGWEQQLEVNKQAFALAFVQHADFQSAYPSTLTADQFVSNLDQNAGGVLTADERANLASALGASPADSAKRAQALRAVAESAALQQREFNNAFVLMQYFGYLQRDPDSGPDSNFDGYNFWLSKLNQFGGDFHKAEMVRAFISSIEYRQRFGQ